MEIPIKLIEELTSRSIKHIFCEDTYVLQNKEEINKEDKRIRSLFKKYQINYLRNDFIKYNVSEDVLYFSLHNEYMPIKTGFKLTLLKNNNISKSEKNKNDFLSHCGSEDSVTIDLFTKKQITEILKYSSVIENLDKTKFITVSEYKNIRYLDSDKIKDFISNKMGVELPKDLTFSIVKKGSSQPYIKIRNFSPRKNSLSDYEFHHNIFLNEFRITDFFRDCEDSSLENITDNNLANLVKHITQLEQHQLVNRINDYFETELDTSLNLNPHEIKNGKLQAFIKLDLDTIEEFLKKMGK